MINNEYNLRNAILIIIIIISSIIAVIVTAIVAASIIDFIIQIINNEMYRQVSNIRRTLVDN